MSGQEGVRPAERPAPFTPVVLAQRQPPPAAHAPHLSLPVFHCGCPGACPLTEAVPPVTASGDRLLFAARPW
jgi:hypothetical protein